MNKTMTQSTQLKLLQLTQELEEKRIALKIVLDTCYIGSGGYDLSEAISDLELVIKHLKSDVLKLDEEYPDDYNDYDNTENPDED